MAKKGYWLFLGRQTISPTDGQTPTLWFATNSVASQSRKGIPIAGAIKKVRFSTRVGGVVGSNENATVKLLKNAVDAAVLTTTYKMDTEHNTVPMSVNVPVSLGDYIGIYLQCPTWVTNPTNVLLLGSVRIEF